MVHGGLCLAHDEQGATVLVEGGIPGEEVDVSIRYRKGATSFAEVVRVIDPSPHRVRPPCPYVPACGGCQLQHITYPHQVELKRDIVVDALHRQRVEHPSPRVHGVGDAWRYRWRGEFHVIAGKDGQPPALGFNRARSLATHRGRRLPHSSPAYHDGAAGAPLSPRSARDTGAEHVHLTAGEAGQELLLRAKPPRGLVAGAVEDGLDLPAGGQAQHDVDHPAVARADVPGHARRLHPGQLDPDGRAVSVRPRGTRRRCRAPRRRRVRRDRSARAPSRGGSGRGGVHREQPRCSPARRAQHAGQRGERPRAIRSWRPRRRRRRHRRRRAHRLRDPRSPRGPGAPGR